MSSGLDLAPGKPLGALRSEPPASYPFSFPFPGSSFLLLSPCYGVQMWLHGPIGSDLCSLQPPVSEAFYGYLVLLEIYVLGRFPLPVTLVQCWYAFVKHS
jgi:hypothetical protein